GEGGRGGVGGGWLAGEESRRFGQGIQGQPCALPIRAVGKKKGRSPAWRPKLRITRSARDTRGERATRPTARHAMAVGYCEQCQHRSSAAIEPNGSSRVSED